MRVVASSLAVILALAAIGPSTAFVSKPHGLSFGVRDAVTERNGRTRAIPLKMNVEKSDNERTVKVGVIGCGRIGIVHLGAITKAPNVVPVIVSNPTIAKAEAAAATYGVPKFTSDAMDVITDPEVDAVWICSPFSVSC